MAATDHGGTWGGLAGVVLVPTRVLAPRTETGERRVAATGLATPHLKVSFPDDITGMHKGSFVDEI